MRGFAGARLLVVLVTALLLSACGGSQESTAAAPSLASSPVVSSAPSIRAPETATSTAGSEPPASSAGATSGPSDAPTPGPSIEGPVYDNPVYLHDFPDPHIILVDGRYYAYSTNSMNQNIPIISSADLATWQTERDALPGLPRWAQLNFGNTWAPGVIQIGETFNLYFVSRDQLSDRQCIGVATSDSPTGPFNDPNDKPFICQDDLGGSIDPYPFLDADGQLYLYWKNDGNCCAKEVDLWVQKLSDDGLELQGEPTKLIQRDQAWEIPLVENPAMIQDDGSYYLFYSANMWDTFKYAVGYASCESAVGPCVKPQDKPIFTYTNDVFGPGGESFVTEADGDLVMAYHAWVAPNVGYPQGQRSLFIDPVTFQNGAPVMTGPTVDPQPLP